MFARLLVALMLTTGLPTLAQSVSVQPVPGSGAAYLYFPDNGDTRAVLKVVKENGMGLATDYEVHFTFDGGAQEVLCESAQLVCEETLKPGTVRLTVKGDWAPGNTSVTLPMSGKFSGACSSIDTTCQFSLQKGTTSTVRIKAGCNARDYSVVKLGGGAEALCVGFSLDGQNNVLLAAHRNIDPGKRPKNEKKEFNNTSLTDGQANTQTILDNWTGDTGESAAHYCHTLEVGSGTGKLMQWYLPALNELKNALAGWSADFTIPKNIGKDGYYSSTEHSKRKTKTLKWSSSHDGWKEDKTKYHGSDEDDDEDEDDHDHHTDDRGDTLCIKGVSP